LVTRSPTSDGRISERKRRSADRSLTERLVVVAALAFALALPSLAYAYTNYRYGSSAEMPGHPGSQTGCCLNRQYNKAYHSTADEWHVRYFDSDGNITWQVVSYSSPTSQGLTTGPRQATCYNRTQYQLWAAWNCDTTVP
jgi:hypothetical protein